MPQSWDTMQYSRGWDYIYFVTWNGLNHNTWENIE